MKSFKKLHKKYSIAKLIKKFDDRYGFQALVRNLSSHWFNPFATIYVNFLSFPLRQAIKLPMFVYGSPKLYYLVGDMKIIGGGNIKTGMIKFNNTHYLNPPCQTLNSELSNLGTIIFHGSARIGCGTRLLVQKNAILELGDNALIGDFVNIGCHYNIRLGNSVRVSHRSQIQESNHHFILNSKTNTINPCTKPILIGECCWICNNTTITSGVTIPPHCIIASNSLVNAKKDISNAPHGSIIGGIPAKVLSTDGRYRIFSKKWETILFQWFAEHPLEPYIISDKVNIEELINP